MLKPVALAVVALLCAGCAAYITPAGPARLADLRGDDSTDAAAREPSPHFPSTLALIRVQAPQGRSGSANAGSGRFSVTTTQAVIAPEALAGLSKWPDVAGAVMVDPAAIPGQSGALADLRLAAAKLDADVMLICTVNTVFRVRGRDYGPAASVPLGRKPDGDAAITATASAVFADVRTGFVYGRAQASAMAAGLDEKSAWASIEAIDAKRQEAERKAFAALLVDAGNTWTGISKRYR